MLKIHVHMCNEILFQHDDVFDYHKSLQETIDRLKIDKVMCRLLLYVRILNYKLRIFTADFTGTTT